MIGAGPTLAGVMLFGLVLAVPIAALTIGDTRPSVGQVPYLLIAGDDDVAKKAVYSRRQRGPSRPSSR